jgi:hypothetical protein
VRPVIDPRQGDVETDVSSPKRRSLLSLAGALLVEISLPKLVIAWTLLLVVPGLLLGLAPIVASDWVRTLSGMIATLAIGIWSLLVLAAVVALGYFGWRALFRLVENSFWALNSVVVQPGYATCREVLRQIAERLFVKGGSHDQYAKLRAGSAIAAGLLICGIALLVLYLVLPSAHLFGSLAEIGSWRRLIVVALANSTVFVTAYLAIGALIWAVADVSMAQPRDLNGFDARPDGARLWRVVHLSDVHVVGERYGFRIESGRSGPRGNDRLKCVLNELEVLHAKAPLDLVLITGDMTDAGSSAEWAEFLDAMAAHPTIAERMLIMPGNHDLNIVDRANPARMDLPTSPNRRLRQLRTLSAMRSQAPCGQDPRRIPGAASQADGSVRRCGKAAPVLCLAGALGQSLSHGAASGRARRPRRHRAELECRHAFLLHQCARHGRGGAGKRDRDREQAVSARLLDHRPTPLRR